VEPLAKGRWEHRFGKKGVSTIELTRFAAQKLAGVEKVPRRKKNMAYSSSRTKPIRNSNRFLVVQLLERTRKITNARKKNQKNNIWRFVVRGRNLKKEQTSNLEEKAKKPSEVIESKVQTEASTRRTSLESAWRSHEKVDAKALKI